MKKPTSPRRIFLLDAHALSRRSLARLISSEPGMSVCGEASDVPAALKGLEGTRPDALVVNIDPLDGAGPDALGRLRWRYPFLPLVVLSMREGGTYGRRVLQAGAAAYVEQGEAALRIIPALRRVLEGGVYPGRADRNRGRL